MKKHKNFSRRQFINTAAAGSLGFTLVPRHVLGGKGYVPPSDKLNLAYIGCGTQGLREMCPLIQQTDVQITAVCDPNKMSTNYLDWSPFGIRNDIRKVLDDKNWGENYKGIPGGRDVGQELVDKYYGKVKNMPNYKGCRSYEDFRELLEKETNIDAVKIMTPDHLHAYISIAAMKKGKHVVIHKPIANRMHEARLTIETARKTGVSTHLLAWSKRSGIDLAVKWLRAGHIGNLKAIHNWSFRPVWPQFNVVPADKPAIPEGFNWDLWLGVVPDRPYHPNYTHNVFRGWYDFGGGSIADMGHYSLWPLFIALGITSPASSAEARGTTHSVAVDGVCRRQPNTAAFPYSSMINFKFAAQAGLPTFSLHWYDGGMKPPTPEELGDKELAAEGMMLVGDKGFILGDFRGEKPRLYPDKLMKSVMGDAKYEEETESGDRHWIEPFKNKKESPGSFLLASPITETIQLGALALRAGKRVVYDSSTMKITNDEAANKLLFREYRKGWEL